MKEVKEDVKEVQKDSLLDIVFSSIKAGKKPKEICKEQSISKQKLQYYLDKLKSKGIIRKKGYGVWEASKDTVDNPVRGHAFMWHLKLPKEIIGWDILLNSKNIRFKLINSGKTHQVEFKGRRVQLNRKSIIINEYKSFFGQNALESKKLAFFELRSLLNELQNKLGVNIQTKDNKFIVRTARNHYSLIKNCLAIQCNKEGKRINVYNNEGHWFSIDNSFNLDEAETLHPDTALTDNLGIQKYFNEHKETHFEVTPKAILNYQLENTKQLNQLTNIISEYGNHIKSHTESIKTLAKALPDLIKVLKQKDEEIKNLKQRKLTEW